MPSLAPLFWCLMLAAGADPPGERAAAHGTEVGAEVQGFHVRQVNAAQPNLSTCLVCKYGARPVAMLCVREVDEQVEQLLAGLDRSIDQRRGDGLRGFALFLNGDSLKMQPQLAALARKNNLTLPLVCPVEAGGPRSLELPADAQATLVLYRDKHVVQRLVFAPGELTKEKIAAALQATEKLLPSPEGRGR
jgi:hypothetical protein